jgi:ABC-2 type transport system ATP-binding protein
VGRPEVVFLDEPTSGVDPAGRQLVRKIVADLRADGVTVLLSTHDLGEAERVADHIVIVDHGRLVADGSLASLTAAGHAEPELQFRTSAPIDAPALATEIADAGSVAEIAPNQYRVAAAPTPALIARITGWLAERDVALSDLQTGRQDLEDVFLELTRSPSPEQEEVRA